MPAVKTKETTSGMRAGAIGGDSRSDISSRVVNPRRWPRRFRCRQKVCLPALQRPMHRLAEQRSVVAAIIQPNHFQVLDIGAFQQIQRGRSLAEAPQFR